MNHNAKKIFQVAILSIFFLIIITYSFFGARDLIFGVQIKDVNIKDGAKVVDSILKISGNAENATNLTVNGREITINLNGDFSETIALLPGYNIINIIAKDKFGYIDEKNYKLIH